MRTLCYWLSLGLIFTIPWENLVAVGGMGTVARAMGLLLAACWVFAVVVTGKIREPKFFHLFVYIFIIWNALTLFWTIDPPETVQIVLTYTQLGGFVTILWDLYTTRAALNRALQAYVLGAYVSAGTLILDFLSGNPLSQHAGRYTAPGFDENDLAGILCLAIPIAWHLALQKHEERTAPAFRIINYAYVPVAVLAILLTGSRTALLGLVPGTYFVATSILQKQRARIALFAGLALAFVLLLPHIPSKTIDRLSTIQTEMTEGNISERAVIWREAIPVFQEHSIFGIGGAAFKPAVGIQKVAHNVVVSILVELGLVGFGLFSLILVCVAQSARKQAGTEARLWIAVVLIWCVFSLSTALEHRKTTWLVFGWTVIAASLPRRRQLQRPNASPILPTVCSPGTA